MTDSLIYTVSFDEENHDIAEEMEENRQKQRKSRSKYIRDAIEAYNKRTRKD